ncbi:MAG: glycosyltransferase [Thermoleophilia bacterium]|nr:glycosyltransferase [Thermoleophilia bacterium]
MAAVELSIVVVNHDGAECLPPTLSALARNTEAADVECVVVDSASRDGSWRGVERHWERARALRFEQNVGFCAGCNRGAEEARGRLVAFVNFDGEVDPGWDEPLRALLDDPSVSLATGLLLDGSGERLEAAGLAIAPNLATYGRDEGEPRSAAPAQPVDVAAASGALLMARRDEFLALGGFYEPLWMYGEEADLALRVPGRIVLHPASAIRHRRGAAAGPPRSRIRLYCGSRNRLVNAARHLPPRALGRAVALSAAFDVLTLAQVRSREAAQAVAAGWRDGLRAMPRERGARTPRERRRAAARLAGVREALAQQRRLGRI